MSCLVPISVSQVGSRLIAALPLRSRCGAHMGPDPPPLFLLSNSCSTPSPPPPFFSLFPSLSAPPPLPLQALRSLERLNHRFRTPVSTGADWPSVRFLGVGVHRFWARLSWQCNKVSVVCTFVLLCSLFGLFARFPSLLHAL